jgi:hypothetical protein
LELLLLLTALFASLTGGSAGQQMRGVAPRITVVQAAQVAQAAVQPARRAIPAVAVQPIVRPERVAMPRLAAAPIPAIRPAFERRRE